MIALFRPGAADRDWPLYGDEYGRMKFDNVLSSNRHSFSSERPVNLEKQPFRDHQLRTHK
jgi:hypothetical protein